MGTHDVRAMLLNERYLGRFVWNQSKWGRVPGQRSRRRIMRPASEWIRHEVPELAIVPKELWDEAHARFRRVHVGARGRPASTGKHPSVLSGLLRCGTCGGSMTVVGRKWKAGVPYTRFGCTAHYSRGDTICRNALTVSERKAQSAILGALKEALDGPEVLARFDAAFRERVGELETEQRVSTPDLDRGVREAEKRIANLTESLARVGWSDALAAKLAEEERRLASLKGERPQKGPRPRGRAPRSFRPTPPRSAATCGTSSPWSKQTPSAAAKRSPATSARSS